MSCIKNPRTVKPIIQSSISRREFMFGVLSSLFIAGCRSKSLPLPQCSYAPISKENNAKILETVHGFFDPQISPLLAYTPIFKSPAAQTAYAHTSRYFETDDDFAYIGVSPDWDNKAEESIFWEGVYSKPPRSMNPEDPVFPDRLKLDLLSHEYLHIIEDLLHFNMDNFFALVKEWYLDDGFGTPTPGGINDGVDTGSNRMKYILWHNLYGQKGQPDNPGNLEWRTMDYDGRYQDSVHGVEEFAYLGSGIALPGDLDYQRKDRLLELSDGLAKAFEGILHPEILRLKNT